MITVSTLNASANGVARSYHHGDLRTALIEAGLAALETTALDALSLRQVAREVGVSATAVYRHFPDKRALLTALAHAGIERLGAYQLQVAMAGGSNDMAFGATGRAYVRWALANPALFRLIFSHVEPQGETVFGDSLAARMLQEKAATARSGDPLETRRLIIQAWAIVHGLAMLMLDGQLPADDSLIDSVIDPATLFAVQPGSKSDESP